MRIDCGDVHIRSYRADDLEALVRYANNPRVAANLRNRFPHPYTQQDGEDWLYSGLRQDPEVSFAIASEQELIGTVGLKLGDDVYEHSAEVGYWLGEPYWGRGIATRVLGAFTDWAVSSFGLLRLHAYVFEDNLASIRVLEKAGYECEGRQRRAVVKLGRVMDQFLFGLLAPEGED